VHKGRLETFSDGVLAIILTLMVLQLQVPKGGELADLAPIAPVVLGYTLSFIYVAIYWNNHHHLLQLVRHINGRVMWANLHLLFWLSFIPVVTSWAGEHHTSAWPTALYGAMLFAASVAWFLLVRALIVVNGQSSEIAQALKNEPKVKLSSILYAIAIGAAFFKTWVSYAIYALVALMWLAPDPRIERLVHKEP
jgi:uncharacterized membrane protein